MASKRVPKATRKTSAKKKPTTKRKATKPTKVVESRGADGRFLSGHKRVGGREPGTPNRSQRAWANLIDGAVAERGRRLAGAAGKKLRDDEAVIFYLVRQADEEFNRFLLKRLRAPVERDEGQMTLADLIAETVEAAAAGG
jgi:hypothetical protein